MRLTPTLSLATDYRSRYTNMCCIDVNDDCGSHCCKTVILNASVNLNESCTTAQNSLFPPISHWEHRLIPIFRIYIVCSYSMSSKYLKEENIHTNHIYLHSCRLKRGPFPLKAVISHEWGHLLDVFYHLVWERWRQKLEWNRLWTLSFSEPLAIKAYYNYYNSNNNCYYICLSPQRWS